MASCSASCGHDERSPADTSGDPGTAIVLGTLLLAFGAACGDGTSPAVDGGGDLRDRDADLRDGDAAASRSDAGPATGAPPPSDAGAADARVSDAAIDGGGELGEQRSAGCVMSQPGGGGFETQSVQVGAQTRTYHVRIPEEYTPERAYPLVMRFHGTGGDGLSGGLDIEYAASDGAIIVAPDGLNQRWASNTRQADLALFDTLIETLGASYCVDLSRVFAYGFSAGAGFTNYLGCVRGDVLRGTAAIASYKQFNDEQCVGRVAGWFLHDTDDEASPLAGGVAARDRLVRVNGCSDATRELDDDCVQYEDCAPDYPVVWCQTSGFGHDIRGDYAPYAVWEFFSTL